MLGKGGLGGLMKQAQAMQDNLRKAQEELAKVEVTGVAGGGMVSVVINGHKALLSIKIDPEAVSKDDVEMLQDLVLAAVSDAQRKADEALSSQMSGMMGGMKIPGLG